MSSTSRSRSENSRSVRPSPATTASPRPVRMPIAIAVLDAGPVEQVAVQLAAGQAVGLDGLGEAQRRTPAGGMRGQQRVTRRVAHEGLKRAGRLGPGRDRHVADDARGELDPVPGQHVRGNELGERPERTTTQFGLRPGLDERPGEPVRRVHVRVGEPGHGVSSEHTPRRAPFRVGCPAPSAAARAGDQNPAPERNLPVEDGSQTMAGQAAARGPCACAPARRAGDASSGASSEARARRRRPQASRSRIRSGRVSYGCFTCPHQMSRGADASGAVRRRRSWSHASPGQRRTPMPVGPISGVIRRQLDLFNSGDHEHAK